MTETTIAIPSYRLNRATLTYVDAILRYRTSKRLDANFHESCANLHDLLLLAPGHRWNCMGAEVWLDPLHPTPIMSIPGSKYTTKDLGI